MNLVNKSSNEWVVLTLATLTTICISYVAGVMLRFESFAFGWSLNFILMIWYTYLASKINLKLESSYFQLKPFEKEGSIYKYFGVHVYRKLLVWIGWEKISRKKSPVKNNLISLKACEYNTRVSEHGHAIIAVIIFAVAIVVSNSLNEAKWLIVTNLLLNIYPIMIQRYNRPRYNRIIDNKTEKGALSALMV